jgi:hypothetical protein
MEDDDDAKILVRPRSHERVDAAAAEAEHG